MAGARSGRERAAIAFMAVWVVFWAAGILIVLYGLATMLASGNFAAVAFMSVWLIAAGFGLIMGVRKLTGILRDGRERPAGARNHKWKDGTGA